MADSKSMAKADPRDADPRDADPRDADQRDADPNAADPNVADPNVGRAEDAGRVDAVEQHRVEATAAKPDATKPDATKPDAAAPTGSTPSVSESTRQKLDDQRIEFGDTIKRYFPVLFILTIVIATSLVVLVAVGFLAGRTMDATVLAASVQVAFGMVLGFVCVYIGLMMTWIGIDAAFAVEGDMGPGSFVLKSASPGLLFAMGGIVLVSVSLHKQIVYEEGTSTKVDTTAVDPNVKRSVVKPASPTSMIVMPPGSPPAAVSPANASPAATPRPAGNSIPPATFSGQLEFSQPSGTKQ